MRLADLGTGTALDGPPTTTLDLGHGVRHDDVRHDDVRHDDVRHDGVRHDDVRHDDPGRRGPREPHGGDHHLDRSGLLGSFRIPAGGEAGTRCAGWV